MEQATVNYLTLVNDAMEEAGSDLASFAVDGSDFTTETDPLMRRFKKWCMRAWRDIQQESLDWEWMSEQAVVNITPGIMFYSAHPINWVVGQANPLVIYDVDGTAMIQDVTASKLVDLTGSYTDLENFGYINTLYSDYDFTNQHVLDFGMKAGGEYFLINTNSTIRIITSRDVSSYVVGTAIAHITLNTYDNDHAVVSSGLYTLTGTVSEVENIDGVNTAITINYTQIAPTFWTDFLSVVPPAFGAGIILNEDGTLMTVSGQSNFGDVDSAIAPLEYTIAATGTLIDVIGGTISSPLDLTGSSVTISAVEHTLDLIGTIDTATDATSCQFTITSDTVFVISGVAFTLFSLLAREATDFDTISLAAGTRTVSIPQGTGGTTTAFTTTVPESEEFKNYIHSWKSFDWSEELDDDDFVEEVREVNQSTFRIIAHDDPAISTELPLQFIPWESFQNKFDFASMVPATPRVISEDSTGRYRLYPPPNRPYTLLFDYVREPQIFTNFDDVPKGLPEEYRDLIMWRTIAYYAEFDEQPSVYNRAWKNYKTLLMKFEMQTREKFHFKSAYPWGSMIMGG